MSDPHSTYGVTRPPSILPVGWHEALTAASLPVQLTSFVGRAREIEAVCSLLRRTDVRLLTLTGTGGIGKTRLAIEVASRFGEVCESVGFVSLAAIRDPELVASSIAHEIGAANVPGGSAILRLQRFLIHRKALLVLDNFEHLLAAAPLVTDLLKTCPRLKVMCTSRTRLNLSGERVFTVPPLTAVASTERARGEAPLRPDAVALFMERASAQVTDVTWTAEDTGLLQTICQRLEGVPLAIELAATKMPVLPLPALLARLDLRLDMLAGGPCDAPDRQRTMRASIAWSYDLLTESQKRVYRRLAVFQGGFSLEAAQAVTVSPGDCTVDVFETIRSLTDQHLVRTEPSMDASARYSMSETVREDALERLVATHDEQETRERHTAFFLALSETRPLASSDQAWLERIEPDHDNVRAALDWSITHGDAETAQRIVAGMWVHFWAVRGEAREGRIWAERARKLGPGTIFEAYQDTLFAGSAFALAAGDLDDARALADEALSRAQATGDDVALAMALHHAAHVVSFRDGVAIAMPMLEHACILLTDAVTFRERRTAAAAIHNLAVAVARQGDLDRAYALATDAMTRWQHIGSAWGMVGTLGILTDIDWERGDRDGGLAHGKQALELCWNLRASSLLVDALRIAVGRTPRDAREAVLMTHLWGAAEALARDFGAEVSIEERQDLDRCLSRIRSSLSPKAFTDAWAAGQAIPIGDLVSEVLAYTPARNQKESADGRDRTPLQDLTRREMEILNYLAERQTDREIGDHLCLSTRTVNAHVSHVFAKLDVRTRRDAVIRARELGLLAETSDSSPVLRTSDVTGNR